MLIGDIGIGANHGFKQAVLAAGAIKAIVKVGLYIVEREYVSCVCVCVCVEYDVFYMHYNISLCVKIIIFHTLTILYIQYVYIL